MSVPLLDLSHGGEAAEVVLAKPPRWVRASIWLLAALILTGVSWAYWSRIDIVIVAPGSVRPKGDLVKIQPVPSGKLLEVRVKEGQSVKEDDILFVLDGKELQNDLDKASGKRESTEKQLAGLRVSRESLVLEQQASAQRDAIGLQTAQNELDRANAALEEAKADYERTEKLARDKVLSQAELQKKEFAQRNAAAAQQIAEQGLALKKKQIEIETGERKRALSEMDSRVLGLAEEARNLGLESDKLHMQLGHLEVKAPVAGTIASIANKNSGEIVRAGEAIATLVPQGTPWVVEALVSNRDAGPLRQKIGGRVKLKFDAFPFRDYGTLPGKLLEVSPDAVQNEKLGPVFKVQIGMDSLELRRGSREGKIGLGMTAIAEIVKEEESVLGLLFREVRDRVAVD